eukprot:TRINITY_DN73361_c0_g1_i1.p1 TRINITY_DN73361_c0_g1~~TRINITY_DN73361_c0_g1_i1.p1  ORF type:complete len:362 (+),score=52.00 TRINITY_DN73361_c0_g1_i1:65-1087(+)
MPVSASKRTQVPWHVLAAVLFLASYALLPVGLTYPLFSLEVKLFGMTVMSERLSTIASIRKLWSEQHVVAAALIVLFSVLLPIAKLMLLAWVAVRGCLQDSVERFVGWTARWTMVDAFSAVLLFVGFATSSSAVVALESGFYAFVAYCLLSIAAAQALLLAGEDRQEDFVCPRFEMGWQLQVAMAAGALFTLGLGFYFPLLGVRVEMLGIDEPVGLLGNARLGPVAGAVGLALAVPALEVLARLMMMPRGFADRLAHWAMSDVLAVAVLVTYLVLNTMPGTSATLSRPGFGCLCAHAALANGLRAATRVGGASPKACTDACSVYGSCQAADIPERAARSV